jgi:hypothetical protein
VSIAEPLGVALQKKAKSRGIIFVTCRSPNSAIKIHTADEEQLRRLRCSFLIPRGVDRIAELHLNSYAGVLLLNAFSRISR